MFGVGHSYIERASLSNALEYYISHPRLDRGSSPNRKKITGLDSRSKPGMTNYLLLAVHSQVMSAIKSLLCIVIVPISLCIQAADLPSPGYGSTHFIVGAPITQFFPTLRQADGQEQAGRIETMLFAPDDDIQSHLINLINQEQHSVKVTIFLLTDQNIMQALINAHQRGVAVEIVADSKHMYDRFSRVDQLCQQGICVFVFNPKYSDPQGTGLMHNKFVIFGAQHHATSVVWVGSFNFTRAAQEYNQEHVVIIKGAAVVQRFTEQFERLKQRCTLYTPQKKIIKKMGNK